MANVGSIVQESLHNQYKLLRACKEKDERIAELEAALRAMVDAHDPDVCWPDVMDMVRAQVGALEVARAVLEQT